MLYNPCFDLSVTAAVTNRTKLLCALRTIDRDFDRIASLSISITTGVVKFFFICVLKINMTAGLEVVCCHDVLVGIKLNITSYKTPDGPHPPPHLKRSHEENGPHLGGLPGPADRVTRFGGRPHLSCESNRK